MTTSSYVVVPNHAAGGTDRDTVQTVVERLDRVGRVTVPEDAEALERVLREADGACIVVVGGDGSVHHVVDRLRAVDRLDLDVALVPLGTGNDLARSARIPLAAEQAAAGLTSWPARPIDLLRAGDRIVVNAVHMGLGAEAAQTAGRWKSRLGALAYPLGAVVAGTWVTPWHLEVRVDGRRVHTGTTVLAGIGNGRTIGGGTAMFPRARLDDGLVDVVVAPARYGGIGRAAFGWALRTGQHTRLPWVRVARGRHVEIHGEPVAGNADGEIWPESATWDVDLMPRAVRLRRP